MVECEHVRYMWMATICFSFSFLFFPSLVHTFRFIEAVLFLVISHCPMNPVRIHLVINVLLSHVSFYFHKVTVSYLFLT